MDDDALKSLLSQADELIGKGNITAAKELLAPAIGHLPANAHAFYLMGLACFSLGDRHAALPYFQKAITLNKQNAIYYNTLGVTLNGLGQSDRAIESYQTAISIKPDLADAYYNLGNVFGKLQRYEEAVQSYYKALSLKKHSVGVYDNLSNALLALKRHSEAILCLRAALTASPKSAITLSNLGNIYLDLKHIQTGMHYLRQAYELDPMVDNLPSNIALGLIANRQQKEAVAFLDMVRVRHSDDDRLRMIRSHAQLHLGNYAEGWRDYEVRLTARDKLPRNEPGRRWKGESYAGKRLLVVSEQGLGDTIWIARYLPEIKKLGGELVMECLPEVIPLIASMGVVDRLIPKQDNLPEADFSIFQCSLPALFSPTADKIPNTPYIQAEPHRRLKFSEALARGEGKLKIGIIWSGNVLFPGNGDRAAPLNLFLQSLSMPGVQLYSLQKGSPAEDLKSLPPHASIIDLAPLIEDFADTAAAVAGLDLVIMTDTSTAHLVGALGKPIWVLLNYVSSWLWGLDEPDTPWYPSMRLFRASVWHDWRGIFDQVSLALAQHLRNHIPKS